MMGILKHIFEYSFLIDTTNIYTVNPVGPVPKNPIVYEQEHMT